VVGEALEVAAGQSRIDGGSCLALPVLAQHLLEDGEVVVVDLVVERAQRFEVAEVLGAQQLGEGLRDLDVEFAHLGEGALQALRDGALREAHAGELSDVLGDVAHTLQGGADAQGRDDDAQIAGDRLLTSEDLDRQLIQCDRLVVDRLVGFDDLFGKGDVAGAEGAGGLVDRLRDQLGDLDETRLHVLERLVEHFAHERASLPASRQARCRLLTRRSSRAKVNDRCRSDERCRRGFRR